MIGQSITNAISPAITKLAEVSENRGLISEQRRQRSAYDAGSTGSTKSLMDIADAFLRSSRRDKFPTAFGTKTQTYTKDADIDWLPTIRELAPGANSNFGIPKGEGSSVVNVEFSIIYQLLL